MKVKRSTLLGITASCAFVKWNSELARVLSAKTKSSTTALTLATLVLCDRPRPLKVVERKDVLQFGISVHDRAAAMLLALFNLLDQECLHVVWLLVAKQSRQILFSKRK